MALLLEREEELAAIVAALGEARDGRGRTLVIEGPAGVGKTALLTELERLAAGDYRVLRARGSELERDFGFGLVRQLFGPLLHSLPADRRAELFAGPAGLAAPIFGLGSATLEVGAAESSLYGLYWMVATLTEAEPLVLVVDDAHWGDAASLRFSRYLGQRLDGLPVLIVLAARPNEPGGQTAVLAAVRADRDAATTRPALLSQAGTAALVGSRLGDRSSAEIEAALHEATGGNPFLVEELITELEAGSAPPFSRQQIAAIGPERIASAVIERARRLDPRGPDVVRAIAVLGAAANSRAVAALAGIEPEVTATIVDALTAAAILSDQGGHDFVHPLLASSVYGDVPAAKRQLLHARAAEVLGEHRAEPEVVAAHLLRCDPGVVPGALEALDAAAASASDRGAPESAATYLTRALAEQPEPARRGELLYRLGGAEVLLREPAAIAHLQEAAALLPDPAAALESWLALIETLFIAGQWDGAVAASEAALARFEGAALPGLLELEALHASGLGYHPRLVAEYDRGLPRWTEAVRGRRDEDSSRLRFVLAALGAIRDQPREEVLELLRPISPDWVVGLSQRESSLVSHGVVATLMVEALDEGEQVVAALLDYGRARGSLMAIVAGVGFAASFEQRRGNLLASEAHLRTGIDVLRENEFSVMALATALNFAMDTLLERRLEDAAALVEALVVPPPLDATFWGGMALEVRAAVRMTHGKRQQALVDLRDAERIFRPLRVGPRFSRWRSNLALALPESDREEALELAAEELELARAVESPRAEGAALRALGVLRGGEEGLATLHDSVAILRESPAQLELARSLAELGAALRRGNQRAEARDQLRAAAVLAERCGAEVLGERVHEELRIAGARPRREALSGAGALTPSERRVAAAAAGGATNREIAQDLFVSLRTVEMHLTNAYRKLDITSRSELAAAFGEDAASSPVFREG